jgi:hypothetical protein
MPRRLIRFVPAVPLLLAACGDLPQPFAGQPGATAARLAQPPPARLAVPPPAHALLTESAADTLAGAVADALVDQEVPAVAHEVRPGDWQLAISAELRGARVVPTYTVRDERGRAQGSAIGVAMPPQAWSDGDPYMLKMEAAAIAPKLADLLTGIDAARKRSDPHSLYNRPAQVAVLTVTGAPGDGNLALTRHMRAQLPKLGDVVQDTPVGADFTVAGRVQTAPGAGDTTRVEIQWLISDAAGHDLGRVVQINEVPKGSITPYWGDVALVVAQEAAGGVQNVILRQTGRRGPAGTGPASQAAPGKPAADQH